MRIEDIIFMLNKHIQLERNRQNLSTKGHLVLHKSIMPHKIIKAYKEIEMSLWYVEGNNKYRVLTIHYTNKILTGQEEDIINKVSNDFILMIFNWMKSNFYDQVIKGEYKGYETT